MSHVSDIIRASSLIKQNPRNKSGIFAAWARRRCYQSLIAKTRSSALLNPNFVVITSFAHYSLFMAPFSLLWFPSQFGAIQELV